MSTEVADVLERAAEVIEQRGWMQGYYYPQDTPNVMTCRVCALGAIAAAAQNGNPDFEEAFGLQRAVRAAARLGSVVDPEWGAVDEWNDDSRRTKAEVIAALRDAAAAERAS